MDCESFSEKDFKSAVLANRRGPAATTGAGASEVEVSPKARFERSNSNFQAEKVKEANRPHSTEAVFQENFGADCEGLAIEARHCLMSAQAMAMLSVEQVEVITSILEGQLANAKEAKQIQDNVKVAFGADVEEAVRNMSLSTKRFEQP